MFTGIVEEIGFVVSFYECDKLKLWDGSIGKGFILVISCKLCFEDIYIGASICVNGVCLTVTRYDEKLNHIEFGISPETLLCTNIGSFSAEDPVNLERATKINDRNSGHYVQGHVDCTGTIIKKEMKSDSMYVDIRITPEKTGPKFFESIIRSIVKKGFIAVDGTSLTICEVWRLSERSLVFQFMLVQYTQHHIIIPKKKVGDSVNIEVDVMGKYMGNALDDVSNDVKALQAKINALEEKVKFLESHLSKL